MTCCSRAKIFPGQHMPSCPNSGAKKINLSQQNRVVVSADRAGFEHPTRETPNVNSAKTCISPFNGALDIGTSAKSADPVCYNVLVGGNTAAALFDIAGD